MGSGYSWDRILMEKLGVTDPGRPFQCLVMGHELLLGPAITKDNGAFSGHVRVYQLINNSWVQIGSDLDGSVYGDEFGRSSVYFL